jgi:hypothetical protein
MTRAARKTMGGIRGGGGGKKKLGREKGEGHGQVVGDTAVSVLVWQKGDKRRKGSKNGRKA